jgi:hypothetical protein
MSASPMSSAPTTDRASAPSVRCGPTQPLFAALIGRLPDHLGLPHGFPLTAALAAGPSNTTR